RWTAVLGLFAQGRPARLRIDERTYTDLHRALRAACRALAAAGGGRGARYEALEELIGPWLSFHVLQKAGPEVLVGAFLRCRQVDQELNGRSWSDAGRRWGRWAAVALVASLLLAALAWVGSRWGTALAGVLAEQWRVLRLALVQSTGTQRLFV